MRTLTNEFDDGSRRSATHRRHPNDQPAKTPRTDQSITTAENATISAMDPLQESSRIEHLIDWFTYTVPTEVGRENAPFQHEALFHTGEILPNLRGYNMTESLSHGKIAWHTEHPEYKICVQHSGKDLHQLRLAGLDLIQLLEYAPAIGGKITRLDFAVDYHGPSSPHDLKLAIEQGTLKTRTHHHEFYESSDRANGEVVTAYTVYIGSSHSEKRLRCYDKAAKHNVQGPWTRIELVAKGDFACRLAQAMVADGIGVAGKQAIRDFVKCDIGWFNQALEGPSSYIEQAQATETDTKGWLLTQILPILVKQVERDAENNDYEVRNAFLRALRQHAA